MNLTFLSAPCWPLATKQEKMSMEKGKMSLDKIAKEFRIKYFLMIHTDEPDI
jgi:hypothetical protein